MWFLTIISYVAILVQIIFVTIAIGRIVLTFVWFNLKIFWFLAAALYYLAELVEEYTSTAKKVIYWMNAVRKVFQRVKIKFITFLLGYSSAIPFIMAFWKFSIVYDIMWNGGSIIPFCDITKLPFCDVFFTRFRSNCNIYYHQPLLSF